jgi:hypothetical protein
MMGAVGGLSLAAFRLFAAPDLLTLRRELSVTPAAARRLLDGDWPIFPTLYQFDPRSLWIEEAGPEGASGPQPLLVTLLDAPPTCPIVRYRTGDIGRVLSHEAVAAAVRGSGMSRLLPPTRQPFLAHAGMLPTRRPSPERILELLSQYPSLYQLASGRIEVQDFRPARVNIELRQGVQATRTLRLQFTRTLEPSLSRTATVVINEYR